MSDLRENSGGQGMVLFVRGAGAASIVIGNDPGERAELVALLAEIDRARGDTTA